MAASFFFYDLETSGINPRDSRIMQFAGQRTDMDLNPIGDAVNILIKLTPDVLPEPDAIMVTGITPQATQAEGITEAEFLKEFYSQVVQPETIFIGFNSVRFDDEFMRYLHYRNFYDPYEWQWRDNCSRWDLLDVVRMTRALRPEGIEWPFTAEGKPTNRLELLTKLNGLDHENAHDALSDVVATIAVAKLIKNKQPGLFTYLMDCRDKQNVKQLVDKSEPFVYASGRYPSETLHTTIALKIADAPQNSALVYDLRYDPSPFIKMNESQLSEACRWSRDPAKIRLPVKTIRYNRCPGVAPTGVVKDTIVQKRLLLDLPTIAANRAKLKSHPEFAERVAQACLAVDQERSAEFGEDAWAEPETVDGQLYGGNFFGADDKKGMRQVREAAPKDCAAIKVSFQDKRLQTLLPLFTARNHAQCLSDEQRQEWDDFCRKRLLSGGTKSRLAKYFQRIEQLALQQNLPESQQFLLEELHLYGESIMPIADGQEQQ